MPFVIFNIIIEYLHDQRSNFLQLLEFNNIYENIIYIVESVLDNNNSDNHWYGCSFTAATWNNNWSPTAQSGIIEYVRYTSVSFRLWSWCYSMINFIKTFDNITITVLLSLWLGSTILFWFSYLWITFRTLRIGIQHKMATISEVLKTKTEDEEEPKKKSREDWRKAKELEEARKVIKTIVILMYSVILTLWNWNYRPELLQQQLTKREKI